jgi:hypothetical protein
MAVQRKLERDAGFGRFPTDLRPPHTDDLSAIPIA